MIIPFFCDFRPKRIANLLAMNRALILLLFLFLRPTGADAQHVDLDFETGLYYFSRNDVRVPNASGDLFDLTDAIKREPAPFVRLRAAVAFGKTRRHHLRALYAPLEKRGRGSLPQVTQFAGGTFAPEVETTGIYRFSTYRLTYRYDLVQNERWVIGLGAALLLRDAKIALQQGGYYREDTDLGAVPLLHAFFQRTLSDSWHLVLDVESLAAPQGRATDLEFSAGYTLNERIRVRGGYRLIEGGADVAQVFNFSTIHFLQAGVTFSL